jgi:hypothetical protein
MKCNECKTGDISIDKFDSKYLIRCTNEKCLNTFSIPCPFKIGSLLIHNYELEQENKIASSFSAKKMTEEQEDYKKIAQILYLCIKELRKKTYWTVKSFKACIDGFMTANHNLLQNKDLDIKK